MAYQEAAHIMKDVYSAKSIYLHMFAETKAEPYQSQRCKSGTFYLKTYSILII